MSTTKRRAKYLLAFVAAAILALAMAVPAFAADTGKLTIKNSETDTTYNLYRILDLTGQDTTSPADGTYDAVTYTLNDTWRAFFITGAGKNYIVTTDPGTGTAINIDGTIKYLDVKEANKVAFTNAAMEYAIENNITPDTTANGNTGSDVVVNNLALGDYLMVPVNAADQKDNPISTGSIASLTSTIPNADIYVKATKPSITKTDNAITVDVGQTVTYTVTGQVPNTSGVDTYVYKISDKMTSGLTFNKDVVITIDGTAVAAATASSWIDYDNSNYANGFVATIPVKDYQNAIGKDIVLTYTAVVNDNAVTTDEEHNTAQLEYGNNPNNTEKTTEIKEEVYTAKIDIVKYTGANATDGTKLANAKFALMKMDGATAKYYKYTAASGTTPAKVEWVAVENAPTSGTGTVTDAMAAALASAAEAETITAATTIEGGTADFKGIADGTYYLVEFAAPDGYNRLEKPTSVTVAGNDVDVDASHVENVANATGEFDKANNATATIQNNQGGVLPSTGGIGTTILYIIGGILVLGAVVFLITKRRMAKVNIESDDTI